MDSPHFFGADVDCVRDLGVLIDSNMTVMTLSNHVNNVAGICFYQLRQLFIYLFILFFRCKHNCYNRDIALNVLATRPRRSRALTLGLSVITTRSLTTDAAHSLVRALIHTRIDYCNGFLAAGPKYMNEKLQSVLRAAVRLVLQLPHRLSVSEIMHWLEMPDRVRFKLCTLVYRCLHGLAPHYLPDLCTPATVHAHLRSLERSLGAGHLFIECKCSLMAGTT